MRIGIRNATFLCTALALAFFMSSLRAHAAGPASAELSSSAARAGHVTLTVPFRTELRCGRRMGRQTLVVPLPSKAVSVSGTYSGKATAVGDDPFGEYVRSLWVSASALSATR